MVRSNSQEKNQGRPVSNISCDFRCENVSIAKDIHLWMNARYVVVKPLQFIQESIRLMTSMQDIVFPIDISELSLSSFSDFWNLCFLYPEFTIQTVL